MELKHYLRAIARHWRVVGAVVLVTLSATLAFVWWQPAVYEASGTYVVRPRSGSSQTEETVRATEVLNRGVEINATYARIARSDSVKQRATAELASIDLPTAGLRVRSNVIPGTNILEIGATGPDPEAVAAYATAVGESAIFYADELGEVYLLQPLDLPGTSDVVAPNNTLTVIAGLAFGVLAGAVLAFGLEYFREPLAAGQQDIWDRTTGTYSEEYFLSRLRQELGRCGVPPDLPSGPPAGARERDRQMSVVTVGVMTLSSGEERRNGNDPAPRAIDLRDAAQGLLARLRTQDVLAYLGDHTYAVLFPDLRVEAAGEVLAVWRDHLASNGREGTGAAPMHATVQTCECDADGLAGDEDIVRVACAR